jgi:hypothetical protein
MLRRKFVAALFAAPLAYASRRKDGGPVIDLHAHYYPEPYLRLV